jgi:hypothetical protein
VTCRGNLFDLFNLFHTFGPVHPLAQIVAGWSRAPLHINGDTARVTGLRLAAGIHSQRPPDDGAGSVAPR